jgi:glycosyltransferase involved in cell wall biosynthesis
MERLDCVLATYMTLATKNPIKLLLLIPHLGGGGAERVTSLLAQNLNSKRFEIHVGLITEDAPGSAMLPAWVVVHRFDVQRVRHAIFKLWWLVWRVRPDLVLSNMAHLNFLLLLLRMFLPRKTRFLVRQNTAASSASNWQTGFLYRRLYPLAAGVVCQSEAMAADLNQNFAIPERKLVVLANPIQLCRNRFLISCAEDLVCPSLLCVARLSREKGLDLLLRALAITKRTFPGIQLTILGKGPEESVLRNLASELGLQSEVDFPGFVDPAPFYASSTLFVSPSRYEGMPNALLEAGAVGLPIVATPSSRGVTELLREAPGTWVAREISAAALAESLVEALFHLREITPEKRRFNHAFLAPFETSRAIHAYESVLLRVEATGHL